MSLLERSSAWEMGVGNFPALERPGPSRRGICLIRASEAKKASYFFASFLTSFLFLLSLGPEISANGETRDFVYKLLQVIDRHVLEVDLLSTVNVSSIGKDANRHPWPGDIRESANTNKTPVQLTAKTLDLLYGSRETLVPLRVVIFQTDLQFDSLDKIAAFFSRGSKEFLDRAPHT